MAIVINGSGTLSGLAVGGLPDGTVDAGTLATDSVTAAKLEVSAITDADLPTGSVIQVVTGTSTTSVSTTSTSFVDTSLVLAITPKFSNSIIIGYITGFSLKDEASAAEIQYRVLRGSTDLNIDGSKLYSQGNSDSKALFIPMTIHFQDSPSTTNATTYKLQMKSSDGNCAGVFYRKQYITLMEIAG